MLPEQGEFLRKAGCLDLSKLKSELLASPSIPDEFKKESENLLSEYRRFLALKTIFHDTSPPLSLSPSAIIDQVWHLHLLTPVHYTKCCKLLAEELIDHDPSVSRDRIELREKRLDMTKNSYKVAFGEDPPQKFWAINYEFSAARVGSPSPCCQEAEKDEESDNEKDERKDMKASWEDKVVDEPSSCVWDNSRKMTSPKQTVQPTGRLAYYKNLVKNKNSESLLSKTTHTTAIEQEMVWNMREQPKIQYSDKDEFSLWNDLKKNAPVMKEKTYLLPGGVNKGKFYEALIQNVPRDSLPREMLAEFVSSRDKNCVVGYVSTRLKVGLDLEKQINQANFQ